MLNNLKIPQSNLNTIVMITLLSGAVAQRVERWTCNQQVVSSNRTRGKAAQQPWARCSHLCASVTKQYNLVPAKGQWCSAAGKVTAGLAEINGSLAPGGWLIVTCGLTAYRLESAPGPTLSNEYGKPFFNLNTTLYINEEMKCMKTDNE